jgi:hypothetical protein
MKEFLLRQTERGGPTGATTDTLTTGGMLEQIMSLFDITTRRAYQMKTPEEWGESYFARREEQ